MKHANFFGDHLASLRHAGSLPLLLDQLAANSPALIVRFPVVLVDLSGMAARPGILARTRR